MQKFLIAIVAMLAVSTLLTACNTSVNSRTERTAVELALLSKSAERTVRGFEITGMAGKTFAIKSDEFEAVDEEWILAQIRRKLLNAGMMETAADDADIHIIPSVATAGIDESNFQIGIPEFVIPIPGAGAIATPEVTFLGRKKQWGRNRVGVYAVNSEDGALARDFGTSAGEAYFSRWRVLFFIAFSRTDLGEPYRENIGEAI